MTRSIFTRRYELLRRLIVEARKDARLTQVELAKKLGKPQSFVSKYEIGERRLDVIEFVDVTTAIGVSPQRLLVQLQNNSRREEQHRR